MVVSADKVSSAEDQVTFFVFTENPEEELNFARHLKNIKVSAFKILPYSWPDATILRYFIFHSQIRNLNSEILMHLDADMLFVANPWQRIKMKVQKSQVCLVEHPGFWRPKGIKKVLFYLRNPSCIFRDVRMVLRYGALGAWERNGKSSAYVARKSRTKYLCGGTWFGLRDSIAQLLNDLSSAVELDTTNGVTAIWHDESHLNKWASGNEYSVENPELCFDETYSHLKELTPSIIAVRKIEKTRK